MKKIVKNLTGTAAPVVAGAIAAKLAKNVAGKVIKNDKLRAALPLVLGLGLLGSKGKTMQSVGLGMIAIGGTDLVGSFVPSIAGIEYMDLSGVADDDTGGYLGDDDDMSGTTLNGETLNGGDDQEWGE